MARPFNKMFGKVYVLFRQAKPLLINNSHKKSVTKTDSGQSAQPMVVIPFP